MARRVRKPDLTLNPKDYRNADCMALAMMKELERRKSKELVSVKTDHNTIVTASESRLRELGIEGIRI